MKIFKIRIITVISNIVLICRVSNTLQSNPLLYGDALHDFGPLLATERSKQREQRCRHTLKVRVSVEAPIQFDVCEQIHAQDRIYQNEEEEETAHVEQGRHRHQEGHDCRAQGVVPRYEEKETHDPQGLYDRHLRPELEGAQLTDNDAQPRKQDDQEVHHVPVVFDISLPVAHEIDQLLSCKDYCKAKVYFIESKTEFFSLPIPLQREYDSVTEDKKHDSPLEVPGLGRVIEWQAPVRPGPLHFNLGFRVHHDYFVVDPLFLFLCEQEVIAYQLLLPVVLRQYHSDEQVHDEEIADEKDKHEEQARQRGHDLLAWDQVYAISSTCLVHNLFPLNIGREYKERLHGIPYIIKVEERILPLPSQVYTVPLGLHSHIRFDGRSLAVGKDSLEIVDADHSKYEVR